ncbi:ThiF family protein [Fimicolochytrium jonesii]|uniref:ThiF family protein n=1 Tax=Fimicolochytrium jonesii TaxID=1396493 RepID=UPI0022FE081F|nr:ThiF family protein [Fimicolochytrium jonesii]KAI8822931.1 ThiF family protein [Fimicolochytrium jonesii]
MLDSRTQKYDRQLRLWQAHGQAALESSKICLLNATAVGSEILKNLILPAIGSFTVVDDKLVTQTDLGNNFFLLPESVGQSRARVVTDLLKELNEEVQGEAIEENPQNLIDQSRHFFEQFTLVVASELTEEYTLKLADLCWEFNVPFVTVKVHGFIAYARIQCREHTVVESHPEQIVDLRLDCPFESLQAFASSIDFEQLDSMAYGHIPYVIILLRCLEEWKASHEGHLPLNSTERAAFKDLIRSKQRAGLAEEQNFEEALAAAYRAWAPTTIPSSISAILNDSAADVITPNTPDFWIIARAVRDFVAHEGKGHLPLAGTVPDMHADTDSYVKLQTIYKAKAREDAAAVATRVKSLVELSKRSNPISTPDIDRFCKNAAHLRLIRYSSIHEEYAHTSPGLKQLGNWLSDPDDNIVWYVLFRAAERFRAVNGRYPGELSTPTSAKTDIAGLRESLNAFLNQSGLETTVVGNEFIEEFTRAGTSSLHSIASLHGGIVAQEIIKLLTHQYVPLDNTVILNGIKSTTSVYRL